VVKKPPIFRRRHWVRSYVRVRYLRMETVRGHSRPKEPRH
jgi:hypothetical protein